MSERRNRASNPSAARRWRQRAADDIPEGWFVNLGIGIPTAVRRPCAARARSDLPFRERRARHGPGAGEGQDRTAG